MPQLELKNLADRAELLNESGDNDTARLLTEARSELMHLRGAVIVTQRFLEDLADCDTNLSIDIPSQASDLLEEIERCRTEQALIRSNQASDATTIHMVRPLLGTSAIDKR
jgi:hypothetical protein